MIEEIINSAIENLKFTPYEETLLTKIKYKFLLSKKDYFDLTLLNYKFFLLRRLYGKF